MVQARLHVICGNCGCNDEWELRVTRDGDDVSDDTPKFEDSVSLTCCNCSTIHDLKDNSKHRE